MDGKCSTGWDGVYFHIIRLAFHEVTKENILEAV